MVNKGLGGGNRYSEGCVPTRKGNKNADAPSRSPLLAPALEEEIGESKLHNASVTCETTLDESIQTLLRCDLVHIKSKSFGEEQRQDPEVMEIIQFLGTGELP